MQDIGRADVIDVLDDFLALRVDRQLRNPPAFSGWIEVYASAKAIYYAPSDLAGPHGMHREMIRSTDLWYGQYERRDTVLVRIAGGEAIMGGLKVARVVRFVAFTHLGERHEAALVEWFDVVEQVPDELTGMWKVRPRLGECDMWVLELIPLDTVVRGCHLIPVYGDDAVPEKYHFSHAHLDFRSFYLNHYADYHSFEVIPRD
jgi:hypothetical protein